MAILPRPAATRLPIRTRVRLSAAGKRPMLGRMRASMRQEAAPILFASPVRMEGRRTHMLAGSAASSAGDRVTRRWRSLTLP